MYKQAKKNALASFKTFHSAFHYNSSKQNIGFRFPYSFCTNPPTTKKKKKKEEVIMSIVRRVEFVKELMLFSNNFNNIIMLIRVSLIDS